MNLDAGFPQVAQVLLWPVPVRVALAFLRALWMRGAMRMQAWQRWRLPHYRSARATRPLDGGAGAAVGAPDAAFQARRAPSFPATA
ncbi:hypothetical protein [Diaphorobacter nitroreducens]|uniref:hypothetical protein n=1 Tax=Diaphorobacter nitroreducens TaxID=164759 RepID=UPI0028ACC12D|nr:hypothetical protein [Diaphorobacter nitroreducens]